MLFDWDFAYVTADCQRQFELQVKIAWDGQVTGIFGHSGSGKSTLLEVLLGLKPRTQVSGKCRMGGRLLFAPDQGKWLSPRERKLAWVPQDGLLMPHLTVLDNLRLTAAPPAAVTSMINDIKIEPLLAKLPGQLSGGERQRVAMARSLLTRHEVLLLDEPFSALDPKQRQELLLLLQKTVSLRDTPTVYVTHRVDEIRMLCDFVIELDQGAVMWSGPVAQWTPRSAD